MPPDLLFSLILGALYGTLFHLWRGNTYLDLLLYIVVGIVGFSLGQLIATSLNLGLYQIGVLSVLEASAISWLSIVLAWWLKLR